MPKESVEISLRYEGKDVADGTMSISDIVPVLQGFASAYGKLSSIDDPSASHKVRIVAVRSGSADIVLEVWRFALDHADTVKEVGTIVGVAAGGAGAAIKIVKKIMGVMSLKKHTKKQPFKERISINVQNSVIITNSDNATLEAPLSVFELFKNGTIDSELNKIVSPLSDDRISSAQIEVKETPISQPIKECVTLSERPYFDTQESAITSTRETWLVAKFNSLTKSTKSGYLNLADGSRVFYKYMPEEIHHLLNFFQLDESIRIKCVAHMDENLQPTLIEIYDIEPHQGQLFKYPIDRHDT